MLTAAGSTRVPAPPPSRRRLAPPIISAALHALVVASLVLLHGGSAMPDSMPPLEVELVQEMAEQAGAPPPPSAPSENAVPVSPAPTGDGPARAPPQPKPPPKPTQAVARPVPPTAAPEINLGNGRHDRTPLTVLGENIRPPAPDARYRNQPPRYPPDAASIGAEGTVQLLARITALGVPADVVVVRSSGNASLDASARDAVLLWHFQPARQGRRSVPFDYVLNVKFTLGDR